MYAVCAIDLIFIFWVPLTASEPAVTVAFVESETVVFFNEYALEKRRFEMLVYKL
jgi:hypothetical protein